jgi:hypothetical protein
MDRDEARELIENYGVWKVQMLVQLIDTNGDEYYPSTVSVCAATIDDAIVGAKEWEVADGMTVLRVIGAKRICTVKALGPQLVRAEAEGLERPRR